MTITKTMISNILSQSPQTVFEFAFSVYNCADNDTQNLTATFTSFPSFQDWKNWLQGWNSVGYELVDNPILIRTI